MKNLILTVMIILLATILFAEDNQFGYMEGRVIIETKSFLTVLQRDPILQTDQSWFNNMISSTGVTNIRQVAEKVMPTSRR